MSIWAAYLNTFLHLSQFSFKTGNKGKPKVHLQFNSIEK